MARGAAGSAPLHCALEFPRFFATKFTSGKFWGADMNLADQLNFDNSIGRLRAMECAIQALILTHPDPAAFGETLHALACTAAARSERDGRDPQVETSDGFRVASEQYVHTAEVAISTRATHAP